MKFYLGTHQPHWLRLYEVPMMVSRRTLAPIKTKPRALASWMRDSGGFTELQMFGAWSVGPKQFIREARQDADEVGLMEYCAPRDWMCEPIILKGGWAGGRYFVGTKLTIPNHQRRTVADFLDLRQRAPELPWMPVIQGWEMDDYLRCVEMYESAGVSLSASPLVGVGTICRRQGTSEAARILGRLEAEGLKLHAFGLKGDGIPNVAPFLASSDSMAWSFAARKAGKPLPECIEAGAKHKNCANCARYALKWLANIQRSIAEHRPRPYQAALAI